MIGKTLSHYEITAKLGEGGMGQVYLARDTQLERNVALKVLPAELADDPERLKRLQREARSLAALDHPHIIPVYSFENADGVHFLTMAFIEGHSLQQLIPQQGFEIKVLLDYAVPLADALRAAHKHGIVHRDLKPANVMVDHEGRLRVLDFGLAKRDVVTSGDFKEMTTRGMTEQMTREGMILGTYPYMSPEQAEGRPVDTRSDIFSFGVLLYEMACGHRPFEGDTGISLLTSILRDHQRPLCETKPDLPARLDKILDRCLEKDPDRRYSSAEVLRNDLKDLQRQVTAGTAVTSQPPSSVAVTEVIERPEGVLITRRHAIWIAMFLVIGAIIGVMAWSPWQRGTTAQALAVLPFDNTLEDPDSQYLCDGIAESLIRQVSGLPALKVKPLSAALHFREMDVGPSEFGQTLDVDTVLTGSLSQQDDRLEIFAQLVDTETGSTLWSNSFDRPATELLGVQDEIATAILDDGLRVELSASERGALARPPTIDGEAYDLFLQARYLQRRATEDDYLQARELLQRATVRDPSFARAYLYLAGLHEAMVIDGYIRPTDGWAQANRYIRQATALDPEMPDAAAIRHGTAFFFDWDWQGAEQERNLFMQSPVGEFDPDLLRTYSLELLALGDAEGALELARRSRELDPLSIGLAMLEADYLVRTGEIDAAIALYERTIEVEPDNPEQYFGLANALAKQGHWDEAIEARRLAHEIAGDHEMEALFAAAEDEEGFREADEAWVRVQLVWLKARGTWAYVSPLDFARAYAQLGEADQAFDYLDQAFADRSPGLVMLNADPSWDRVRDDPRFEEAVRRIGLPTAV